MSFKPIRTFLTDRLIETDGDFKAYNQAFENVEVGVNSFNKRFHIFYGNVTTESVDMNTTKDIVSATVALYFQGARTSTAALDNGMDTANLYRIACLKRTNYAGLNFIKKVACTSITASPVDQTNDNALLIRLEFRISVMFGLGVDLNC